MKRVIAKVKLDSRTNFVAALGEIKMEFSEPYWQHDRIFVPKNYSREKSLPRLSLRTIVKDPSKDAIYALVMRRHFSDKNIDVVNSTVVKDYTEAAHILYQLGYTLKAEISRHREELTMGNSVKVYIDRVDGLQGYYAKIESDLSDEDEPKAAYDDLIETFKVLDVKRKPIAKTYSELLDSSAHETV